MKNCFHIRGRSRVRRRWTPFRMIAYLCVPCDSANRFIFAVQEGMDLQREVYGDSMNWMITGLGGIPSAIAGLVDAPKSWILDSGAARPLSCRKNLTASAKDDIPCSKAYPAGYGQWCSHGAGHERLPHTCLGQESQHILPSQHSRCPLHGCSHRGG